MITIIIQLILLAIIVLAINSLLSYHTRKTYEYIDKRIAECIDTDNTIMDAVEALNRRRLKERKEFLAWQEMVKESFDSLIRK